MAHDKTRLSPKIPTRDRILDAAERLLAQGRAAFSMRDLADEAGVSFATPFNQFRSKATIMVALSARRIALMYDRLSDAALPESAVERVLGAVDIAVSVMLAAPAVNRAVMGAIGAPSDAPSDVSTQSRALWAKAIGPGIGLVAGTRPLALDVIPDQLAIAFRGVLSFWTAGEVSDQLLSQNARTAAAAILLGFADNAARAKILQLLRP